MKKYYITFFNNDEFEYSEPFDDVNEVEFVVEKFITDKYSVEVETIDQINGFVTANTKDGYVKWSWIVLEQVGFGLL